MGAPINYVGRTYNYLHVLEQKRENKKTYLYCRCTLCGTEKWIRADAVTSKRQVSCGCYNTEHNYFTPKDITNKKFGFLTAKYPTDKRDPSNGSVIWHCECTCGNGVDVPAGELVLLRVQSCGCLVKQWSRANVKILNVKIKDYYIDGTYIKSFTSNKPKNNTSGYKGVIWDKDRHLWAAQIGFKGKTYHLGRYANIMDAAKARAEAEEKIFGKFLDWYHATHPTAKRN